MTGFIDPSAIIGGGPETRDALHDPWTKVQFQANLPPDVHATAVIQPFVTVDAGTKRRTVIGADALLLAHSHVGHDALIGARAELSTGAIIGGHAEVGDDARIGLGAVVLPFRKVGAGAVVGAGAIVTKDVPAGETWAGNPARRITPNPVPFTERDCEWCHGRGEAADSDGPRLCPHCPKGRALITARVPGGAVYKPGSHAAAARSALSTKRCEHGCQHDCSLDYLRGA